MEIDNDWLKERQKGIGGSDISVILGINIYKTPYELWLEKTGRSAPIVENKFMRAGKLIEPVIVEMFRLATDFEILEPSKENILYHHPDHSFILGTPDRFYQSKDQMGILECKNTRTVTILDNLPKSWFCQIQWYMGLTGIHRGYLAWLVQGYDFFCHEIEFLPNFWDYLVSEAIIFWNYVLENQPPPLQTQDNLDQIFPKEIIGKSVIAQESTIELYQRLLEIRAQSKIINLEETKIIKTLKLMMKDSEILKDDHGKILITWQTKESNKNRRFLIKK